MEETSKANLMPKPTNKFLKIGMPKNYLIFCSIAIYIRVRSITFAL